MASIRAKIVVPFAALFVAVIVVVAILAAHTTAQNVEARIQGQMADLASVLSQAAFAGNPQVLSRVKTIVGGELATVDAQGKLLVSTLDGTSRAASLSLFLAAHPPAATEGGQVAPTRRMTVGDTSYRATYAPIESTARHPGPVTLYLLVPEAEFSTATWRAIRPIVLAALCGAVAAVLIGYGVAHLIARPIEALAGQMRGLAGEAGGEDGASARRDEVRDLSEAFKSLLGSLRRAEAKLIGSERLAAVGQVAAAVGHELRNPLSGIKMSAQLLEKKLATLGEPDDESVKVILAEIARLEVILDDLRTFAGPPKLDAQPGDLNEVVRGVLFFMKRQLDHADVMIDDQLAADLPDVPLDAQRMRQVVLNLVLNATEAMPGGGTLTVHTKATPDVVEATLEDTGRGIQPDDAERIFEPFFTTKQGGGGLGLPVSRLIVEAHGGTLRGDSTGIGSRFVVSLPRQATRAPAGGNTPGGRLGPPFPGGSPPAIASDRAGRRPPPPIPPAS